MTANWLAITDSHNVWLKDYPHILIPLMLGVGAAMIAIGFAGLRIHVARRKSAKLLPKFSVLLFAVLAGIFLIVFALWIFVAEYVRA